MYKRLWCSEVFLFFLVCLSLLFNIFVLYTCIFVYAHQSLVEIKTYIYIPCTDWYSIFLSGLYILRTSIMNNWRISSVNPWAFWEIQDGRQDGRHPLVKTKFWIISRMITSDTSFPTNLGSRNWFFELILSIRGQYQGQRSRSRSPYAKLILGYICIIIVCNTIASTNFYILRTLV